MKDFIDLTRPPALLTPVGDVILGYCLYLSLTAEPYGQAPHVDIRSLFPASLVMGILTSVLLYAAGMVFNDVADVERDKILDPIRPIPSGAVTRRSAARMGIILMGLAMFASVTAPTGYALFAAIALATCILAYDFYLKAFIHPGALAMGLCRGLNVLLGAAFAITQSSELYRIAFIASVPAPALLVYTYAVTLISTQEEKMTVDQLALGCAFVGLSMFFTLFTMLFHQLSMIPASTYFLLMTLTAIHGYFFIRVIATKQSSIVHRWTSAGVKGILLFDAAFLFNWGYHPQGYFLLFLFVTSMALGFLPSKSAIGNRKSEIS
jgi:4-hydroxybenzoate polyprenyltransferase